jgi:hypothetical protein
MQLNLLYVFKKIIALGGARPLLAPGSASEWRAQGSIDPSNRTNTLQLTTFHMGHRSTRQPKINGKGGWITSGDPM